MHVISLKTPLARSFKMGFSVVLFALSPALAQAAGMFTDEEVRTHRDRINIVTETAARCLDDTWQDHVQFYEKWKVSKYYGNRKPEHRTAAQRRQILESYGLPGSLESELEATSCIGLTLKCLGEGFKAAGQEQTWGKIYSSLAVGNNFYGTDLQKHLRDLGWKTLYWNPDPSQNKAWDAEDRALNPAKPGKSWNPVWGGHAAHYNSAVKKGVYYNIPVDDSQTLVGFKTSVPDAFKQQPFFVGIAHAGYHVFPGKFGGVIEAHSMRNLNAFDNLEVSPFNPLAPNGGPRWTRSEKYRSGLIVVPPSR